MSYRCPNFVIEEDCCVSSAVNTSSIESYYINNLESITTNTLHASSVHTINKSLNFDEGHILTKQTIPPTITHNVNGITNATLSANATDMAGTVTVTGTPTTGAEVYIHFHTAYPTPSQPVVSLSGNNPSGALAFVSGIYASGSPDQATIVFSANVTAVDPIINYQVIGTRA